MYAPERRQVIRQMLDQQGRVSVAELADRFQVAAETVRRDLDLMSEAGDVQRVHGGAILTLGYYEPDVLTRSVANIDEKRRIGARAAQLLPKDRPITILLDGGTTTAEVIPHLVPEFSHLLTNSLPNALSALTAGLTQVDQLPGHVRGPTQATVGVDTVSALRGVNPEFVFLGCNGMTPKGFTTPDTEEAAVKAAMVRAGATRILLADSSKAGQIQYRTFAIPADIDILITDTGLSPQQRAWFDDKDIEVILA